jgi:hypothetical protein
VTLGDGIKERLLAMAPLTSLVGQRVFELVLPQNEKRTAVRFFVMGAPRPTHRRGPVNHFSQRVQVDSYVPIGGIDPLGEVKAIADAVMGDGLGDDATGLSGWRGSLVGSPDTLHVFDVEVTDDGQGMVEMDEIRRVRIRQEYRVHWRALA